MSRAPNQAATSTARPTTTLPRPNFSAWLPRGTSGLLPDIVGGILQGLMCIIAAFVYTIYIFSHAPAQDIPAGIGALLIGTLVLNLVLAFGSKLQPVIAGPQDTVAVLLLVMVSAVAATLGARSPGAVLPTVLLLMLVSSVALGASYLVVGSLHLGQWIRYLPYPVIGGFLVGTGWYLFVGGFGIALTTPLIGRHGLSAVVLGQLGAAVAVAVGVGVLQRLLPGPLTIIVTLLAAVIYFYLVLVVFRVSVTQARADGWLLGTLPSGNLLHVRWIGVLPNVSWGTIVGQAGNIFTLLIINVVGLLLNLAGLEVSYHESADVDHELRVRGIANVLAGVAGGVGGFDYVIFGVLARRGGARSRIVPLVAALLTLVTLLGGITLLGMVPRFVLAGMMFLFGMGLLADWLIGMWPSLPRLEYAIIVLIGLVVIFFGFFQGLVIGLIAAIVLFAINYSRTGVIKHDLAGTAYHSTVDRPLDQQRALQERSTAIHVYELQGYIFFGTAYSILQRVRARLAERESNPLRYVVIDYRHVSGLDSSAAYSFTTLDQLVREHGAMLLYTHLSPQMRKSLKLTQEGTTPHDSVATYDDTDHALEWCENQLLADFSGTTGRPLALRLAEGMGGSFGAAEIEERLLAHLEYTSLSQGGYLTHQGEAASEIYLINTGRVAVTLELPSGEHLRLRVMNAGTLVGELAFYRHAPRTASVIAIEPTTCYRVSWSALQAIEEHDAAIVAAFHAFVACVLSERLTTMDATVAALLR